MGASAILSNAGIETDGDEFIVDREILAGRKVPSMGLQPPGPELRSSANLPHFWAIFMASTINSGCFRVNPNLRSLMNSQD